MSKIIKIHLYTEEAVVSMEFADDTMAKAAYEGILYELNAERRFVGITSEIISNSFLGETIQRIELI
jgi:hypothetical protein